MLRSPLALLATTATTALALQLNSHRGAPLGPVSDTVAKLEDAAQEQDAGVSQARAASGVVAADDLTDDTKRVDIIASRTNNRVKDMAQRAMPRIASDASARMQDTAQAERDTAVLFKSLEIKGKKSVADGAGYAAKEADKRLSKLLNSFEDWRFASLHDPEREAATAAYKAAAPYEKAMMKVEQSVAEHQQQAEFLNSQAFQLQDIAKATAYTAVAKQAAVDLEGAQKDMMTAHHMMAQAGVLGARAFKLAEKAKLDQINVPAYKGAAQMAAATAAHRYAPKFVPSPPVSPKAFNPPPPPTNVSPASPPELWPMAEG